MSDSFTTLVKKGVEAAAVKQAEEQLEKEIEIRIRIISAAYDRATAYTNMIIVAGYAAIFTVWSLTREYLPEATTITIGLSVGISLFVFCGWEVFKMIYTSGELRGLTAVLLKKHPPQKFFEEVSKVEKKAARDHIKLCRYWYFVLIVSIPTGFGAGLVLFYNST